MHSRSYRSLFVFLLVACSTVFSQGKQQIKVLYIGNSLTYENDLPALVAELGLKDSTTIAYHTIALPNYSLDDHWTEGRVQNEIEKGKYNFVVVQQGPSALPESQRALLESAKKFAALCHMHHSKMILYMVWPSKARLFDLDNVMQSYSRAAAENNAGLCAAGLAWKYAWEKDESIALYGPDEFHPSLTGSVLAAMVMYAAIAEKNKLDFVLQQKFSWRKEVNKKQTHTLHGAAIKVLGK